MKFYEIHIKEWNDLFKINQEFLSCFVFRGQGNADWSLETSLRRMVDEYHNRQYDQDKPLEYEMNMIKDFKWRYPTYQSNPNMMPGVDDEIEWLSVMQHYGAKTRLLDFSFSLYVALYMALYGAFGTDIAVWAINIKMLQSQQRHKFFSENNREPNEDEIYEGIYECAQEILHTRSYSESSLFIIRPKLCNERISRQQGLFLMPSIVTRKFEDILSEYTSLEDPMILDGDKIENIHQCTDAGVIKFVISNEMRYALSTALLQMNISAETMFPGVEGLAQSVNKLRRND